MSLPKELFYKIYSYDNTCIKKFENCVNEIKNLIKIHKMIYVTYISVVLEQRKYFNYDEVFFKYCLKKNKNLNTIK